MGVGSLLVSCFVGSWWGRRRESWHAGEGPTQEPEEEKREKEPKE